MNIEFTAEEKAYRRGYMDGYRGCTECADVSIEDVCNWEESNKEKFPPGATYEGKFLLGFKNRKKDAKENWYREYLRKKRLEAMPIGPIQEF